MILLNASFSFVQELQAERAVEALAAFLPERARVLRDGSRQEIEARLLVPGDVLLIEEAITRWLRSQPGTAGLPVGYFGASTGAAATLAAVTATPRPPVAAIVSRGGPGPS